MKGSPARAYLFSFRRFYKGYNETLPRGTIMNNKLTNSKVWSISKKAIVTFAVAFTAITLYEHISEDKFDGNKPSQ